jgi:colanic acid/amylovoran biosynthesis protein
MKNKIVIYGAGFNNKGAQAMTFTLLNEIRNLNNNIEVILASNELMNLTEAEKKNVKADFIRDELSSRLYLSGGLFRILSKLKKYNKNSVKITEQSLKNAICCIDISGYALASKWRFTNSLHYLLRIKNAHKYGVPFIIFPQSFGPFNYPFFIKPILSLLMKNILPTVKVIYAREEKSYHNLEKFSKKNLKLSEDLVFFQNNFNVKNIFEKYNKTESKLIISKKSVAIIPNSKNYDFEDKEVLDSLYLRIIDYLLSLNYKIVFINHSKEDIIISERLFSNYEIQGDIKILSEEMYSFELENLLAKFDFVIASRYHSIVHSLRANRNCLIIGWANKYLEIANTFEINNLVFDVRVNIDYEKVISAIDFIINNNENYIYKIIEKKNDILKYNLFKDLEETIGDL